VRMRCAAAWATRCGHCKARRRGSPVCWSRRHLRTLSTV
jgi:hypothetical protein